MTRIDAAGQRLADHGYDLLSRRTSQLRPGGGATRWAWQLNDVLAGVEHGFAGWGARQLRLPAQPRQRGARTRGERLDLPA